MPKMAKKQEWTVERVFLNKFSSHEAIEKIIKIYIANGFKEEKLSDTENK